jgi:apolipoprotein D and lipocalin family protein
MRIMLTLRRLPVPEFLTLGLMFLMSGCSTVQQKQPALTTVAHVDLNRFMGGWYVIGTIPWIVERNNVGTMDVYKQRPDGRIGITYVFHKDKLTAKKSEMHAVGTVVDKVSNAVWKVQFIWPFQAPYLVIDLASDYRYTVIGYPSRDLVWIMSRAPSMSDSDYQAILSRLAGQGYDITRIRKVPQITDSHPSR